MTAETAPATQPTEAAAVVMGDRPSSSASAGPKHTITPTVPGVTACRWGRLGRTPRTGTRPVQPRRSQPCRRCSPIVDTQGAPRASRPVGPAGCGCRRQRTHCRFKGTFRRSRRPIALIFTPPTDRMATPCRPRQSLPRDRKATLLAPALGELGTGGWLSTPDRARHSQADRSESHPREFAGTRAFTIVRAAPDRRFRRRTPTQPGTNGCPYRRTTSAESRNRTRTPGHTSPANP